MVTIELSDETATALTEQAEAAGLDLQTFLARMAGWRAPVREVVADQGEWLRRWHALIASMPPTEHFVDDSRESIYDDRGR